MIYLLRLMLFALPLLSAAGVLRAETLRYHLTDIGSLGGSFSQAIAVNDNGQVVGSGYPVGDPLRPNGAQVYHAFLYSGGTLSDLGTLGGQSAEATGINNNAQIVGTVFTSGSGVPHAFVYSNGAATDLQSLFP
jgi:probable HAF family extracellular repeat protein